MSDRIERHFLDHQVLSRLSRLDVIPRGLVAGSFSGQHKSPHRGSSVEFAEYRKYVPGDDIRHIDWRVYARSDRFYLKEFEADTNLRCYLILDCSASMGFTSGHGTKFDYARRLAATLAYLLIHQGDFVGLQCFTNTVTHDIPPRGNPAHLRNIFDQLEKIEPTGETQLVPVLHDLAERFRRRALVIVFSDFFTDVAPLLECFQHMRHRKHDLAVFHLLDPLELSFRFERPIRFIDLETRFALVTEPGTIQQQYHEALQQYLKDMQRGCREFNVDYRQVVTSTPYDRVLTDFLLERMRKGQSRS